MTAGVRTTKVAGNAQAPKALRVGFILSKSFTLSAFALFVDTLRLASDSEDGSRRVNCDWDVLSSSRNFITSSSGIQVAPTAPFADPSSFDYIAVVGGLLKVDEPIDGYAMTYLRKAAAANVGMIGLCTGSFILAEAGLLRGHTACVSWLHHREFRGRFPDIEATSEQIFRFDGRVATCAGGSSVADLAATLVRHHVGEAAERNALEILQIRHRRDATDVQPRNPLGLEASDRRVHLAIMMMEQHTEDLLAIDSIATMAGVSRRQLERLFESDMGTSPSAIYMKIRMAAALNMVMKTNKPLIEIALETGFESLSHFTRRFRAAFGDTPSQIRRDGRRQAVRSS
jgi:transcriptional regulator GlxA family with amidase domain